MDSVAKTPKASLRSRIVEKIRSELNIEKWPAIWQPAKSKNKPTVRTMTRELTADDGTKFTSRVEVGYTQLGTLTTEEQKLLYVLIKLWEDHGKPDVQVFFSTRGLARLLKKKGWGTNVIQAITKSLRKLRTIPVEWINSYHDQSESGKVLVDRRPFTILGDLRIIERHQDGSVNSSLGYFKFDDSILRNLQLNYTKPVCIDEFFKLKSEIAQLIYTHIDLMLYDKPRYERKSRELFDDLGLKNPEYDHMYERRRALEKAVRELEGIRLSSGAVRSATLEKTNDGKDYKVTFVKTSTPRLESLPDAELMSPVVVNHYAAKKDQLALEAEEVVKYFHKIFYDVDSHMPQSKETEQALSLVSQHGSTLARSIVELAHAEAQRTGFAVQHFGAVLSYTSRALAEATRRKRRERAMAPTISHSDTVGQSVIQIHPCPKGEARLARLSPADAARRYELTKAALFQEQPFLAHAKNRESAVVSGIVRLRVIQELDAEPMDMILFDTTLVERFPWIATQTYSR